jgi:hypothetical protein
LHSSIQEIKGGIKLGCKISDSENKWTEQWFEVKMIDNREAIKVKCISKMWAK